MIKDLKQFFFIAGLLLIAAGAQPVGAAVWQWSTTPANNATADPTVNWAEGMSPSSVNDSARAMMAAIAKWNFDNSGTLQTGGTTSAITLTSNSGYGSLSDLNGQRITFFYNQAPNVAGATLNIDGTGNQPIYENGAPITDGRLQLSGLYTVTYYTSVNRYYLHSIYNNPYNVPLGGLMWSTISTAPNANFVAAAGQCLSTTTYATYWAAIGSPAPAGGCTGGQFQIIDLRGRVVAGLDTLAPTGAAGRMTTDINGCNASFTSMGAVCANGAQSWTLTQAQMPAHYHTAGIYDPTHTHGVGGNGASPVYALFCSGCGQGGGGSFGVQGTFSISAASTGVRVNSSNGLDTTYNAGSGGAHPSVQPTMALYPYIRVQ